MSGNKKSENMSQKTVIKNMSRKTVIKNMSQKTVIKNIVTLRKDLDETIAKHMMALRKDLDETIAKHTVAVCKDHEQTIEEILDCPICCQEGKELPACCAVCKNSICSDCFGKINKCPFCRADWSIEDDGSFSDYSDDSSDESSDEEELLVCLLCNEYCTFIGTDNLCQRCTPIDGEVFEGGELSRCPECDLRIWSDEEKCNYCSDKYLMNRRRRYFEKQYDEEDEEEEQ